MFPDDDAGPPPPPEEVAAMSEEIDASRAFRRRDGPPPRLGCDLLGRRLYERIRSRIDARPEREVRKSVPLALLSVALRLQGLPVSA